MARYALNLPTELKREAELLAQEQGVSLNQFILWSVADKVSDLRHRLDDSRFPGVTYRVGAAGQPTPVLRGTGIRVQTLVVDTRQGLNVEQIADEYDLNPRQVSEALGFYQAHRLEIDTAIQVEEQLEPRRE
jgi:uncharacterized protein (DUF433 family)